MRETTRYADLEVRILARKGEAYPVEMTLNNEQEYSPGSLSLAELVLVVMAAITLLLSLFGVHGVLSYAVAQRRREMGIRTALGARRSDVAALILRSGLTLGTLGVAFGLLIAVVGSRYLSKLLFEVPEIDPPTYALVAVVALAVSLLASWIPARRAARGEVLAALRAE